MPGFIKEQVQTLLFFSGVAQCSTCVRKLSTVSGIAVF